MCFAQGGVLKGFQAALKFSKSVIDTKKHQYPEFLRTQLKRHFCSTKEKKEDTGNTKLDVDDASLCVLCVLFFFLCD